MQTLDWLERFCGWLWQASWQATVLVGLVALVLWLGGSRLGAKWRYYFWLLVVVRLLVPVSLESPVSVFNWVRLGPPVGSTRPRTLVAPENARLPHGNAAASISSPGEDPSATPTPPTASTRAVVPGVPRLGIQRILSLVWLGGATCFVGLLLGQYLCQLKRLRRARRVQDREALEVLAEVRHAIGLNRPLLVLETEDATGPALFGFMQVRLLLPHGLLRTFARQELKHVFLHELAHLKRGDFHLNWVVAIVQVLHWFNPVLWLAFARMRADREVACDTLALACAPAGEGRAYADTIIKLLEGFSRPEPLPGAVGILEDKNHMKRRITMITQAQTIRGWPMLAVTLLSALGLVAITDAQTPVSNRPAAQGTVPGQNSQAARTQLATAAEAIAALEKLGAQIERDEQSPGKPVVKVSLWEKELRDADLAYFAALPDLRSLLIPTARVTDEGLSHLTGLTNLLELNFSWRSQITDAGMVHLARLPRLQTLRLGWVGITDDGIREIRGLVDLHTLSLVSTVPRSPDFQRITDKTCQHLQGMTRMESLTLMNADITSQGLAHLAGLTNLTAVNLGANPRITDDGLEHLVHLSRLSVLQLFSTGVSDDGLAHLGSLSQLETLSLSGTEITDAGLVHLKSLANLRSLTLGGEMVPTADLGATHVTDAGLVQLQALPNLEKLWLDRTRVTDAGLSALKPLKKLRWLGLNNTRVTDAGLGHLKGLRGLESLGLWGTAVTDQGLASLSQMTGLRELGLGGTRITDEGLKHLKALNQLTGIQLEGTQVTQAGVDELQRALPQLKVQR